MTLPTFTEHALPYCVFSRGPDSPRVGAGLGAYIIDLHRMFGDPIFAGPSLNAFMSRGPRAWQRTRERLVGSVRGGQISELVPIAEATLHLPFEVADFADFYSSLEHATNAARVLRPGDPQLHRNWREMPVGYHGRSGTVVVSGTPVPRPRGQLAPGHARPELAPTRRLDFEAEIGFVVGMGSAPGQPCSAGAFTEHVFGVVLLIDWSARDIQAFESRPLGPFLGKSFATTISPWVVPLAALGQALGGAPGAGPRAPGLPAGKRALGPGHRPLGEHQRPGHLAAPLRHHVLDRSPAARAPDRERRRAAHRRPLRLGHGVQLPAGRDGLAAGDHGRRPGPDHAAGRSVPGYLADGDTVTLSGSAPGPDGSRIEFGSASGQVVPAG